MNKRNSSRLLREAARLVRERMHATGVTQVELARRVGHTPKHVSRVLNGTQTAPDISTWALSLGSVILIDLVPISDLIVKVDK